ncbi:class A beta-lactamase [Frateuria aurantia]
MTHQRLQLRLQALAAATRPGVFGIVVLDPDTGERWSVQADQPLPMMSVFKVAVAAATLDAIDHGRLTLEQRITVTRSEVDPGSAVPSIGAHFRGERMDFSVAQLLQAAVSDSDNTAVDALLRRVPPAQVTAFLRQHGITGMRVDVDEAAINREFQYLRSGQSVPLDETSTQRERRLQRGYAAYLADPRNRTTPTAAAEFLLQLLQGRLLSPASSHRLLSLMQAQTRPSRLRRGLSGGARLADKCGTSASLNGRTAAYNDIGIVVAPNGKRRIVAAFLTDSSAPQDRRDAWFAELARAATAASGRQLPLPRSHSTLRSR